jgi:hypothetical protein
LCRLPIFCAGEINCARPVVASTKRIGTPSLREVRTPRPGLVRAEEACTLTCVMRKHPEPRPRDDKDAARDTAGDLAEIASHIGRLKGDANAYLRDQNYNTLKLRLEIAHSAAEAAAVEARRRVRLDEQRGR